MTVDRQEVARITIVRFLTDVDDMVSIEATEELAVIEGAGMLAMAVDTWHRTNGLRDEP